MKRILICIIAVFVFFAQSLCAQQTAADQTAQVSIKLYDRTIYYPDSAQNNPHKREFYLAQIPFTSKQIEASNLKICGFQIAGFT